MSHAYSVFGLSIQSDFLLPELAPLAGEPSPEIRIKVAALAESIPDAKQFGRWAQVSASDFLLTVPDVARYRVRDGAEILVDPVPNAGAADIRLFLLGTALATLCYQRGLEPLHANAIDVDGKGVAFAGPSGSGKSTLAAFLARRKHRVLCDDLCVLSFESNGRILAWPGSRRFKLWEDALTELGTDANGLERVIGNRNKFHFPSEPDDVMRAVPLRRLYVLERAADGESGGIYRLSGADAMRAVLANTYRPRLIEAMGRRSTTYAHALELLRQMSVFSFERRWGFDVFEQELETLERHLQAAE